MAPNPRGSTDIPTIFPVRSREQTAEDIGSSPRGRRRRRVADRRPPRLRWCCELTPVQLRASKAKAQPKACASQASPAVRKRKYAKHSEEQDSSLHLHEKFDGAENRIVTAGQGD